jgi:hypothetical protein
MADKQSDISRKQEVMQDIKVGLLVKEDAGKDLCSGGSSVF